MVKTWKLGAMLTLGLASGLASSRELSESDFLADLPTVLTSSRLAQSLMDAPNAITVIDRGLIEASGYHNLSDLFRFVPGVYVGQKKGWFHNVSHTMADEYSRRMQVMVDGRSVYLPSFGGVRWDTLPLAIEDIERIEVVRGPNAASFGANAMTGIINIITRHPEDVTGRMLSLKTGDQGHGEAWFRWAGSSESMSHRLTLGRRLDEGMTHQWDDEVSNILTYRGDVDIDPRQEASVQFGLLRGKRGEGKVGDSTNQPHDQDVGSGYFQADYRLNLDGGESFQAKLYFNQLRADENVPTTLVPGSYYEADVLARRWHLEAQLDNEPTPGVRTVAGGYLRRDSVQSLLYWNTADRLHADSWGLFGHMEWRLADSWLVNLGAFWEDYEKVGGRLSPRATLHWQPSPRHAFRVGIAKAYRNPVLLETEGDNRLRLLAANGAPINLPPVMPYPSRPFILASGNVKPEEILSREIGYLGQWPELGLSLDVRLFSERIANFISAECPTGNSDDCKPSMHPITYLARDWYNIGSARQQGYEIQVKWQPGPRTQIIANQAFLDIDSGFDEQRYSPPRLAGLHLSHKFSGGVDLMVSHYWVSSFEPIGQGVLPAYRRWDARLAKNFKLDELRGQVALVWENLSDAYLEFADDRPDNLYDRRAYLQVRLDF